MNDLIDYLENYSKKVEKAVDKERKRIADKTKKQLQQNSPKRTGKYSKGWGQKTEIKNNKRTTKIYNKKHYRLTHLLEDGHRISNQYMKVPGINRTKAQPHFNKIKEEAENEFYKEVKKIISKEM